MTNLSFPQAPGMEAFLLHLHRAGICVSRFSACADSVAGPSAILAAMGRPPDRSRSSLRIALGRFSRREDVLRFVAAVAEAHEQQRVLQGSRAAGLRAAAAGRASPGPSAASGSRAPSGLRSASGPRARPSV
jgi:cysteine desulfurase